ncbi:LINE-1 type transposase domain-containing protein 1 [Tamandua tetradactyla]|uniref:LINE-1 type transposase domain-containing protein 1 n=1 Tax=Tamandua tetradactyla TaxID=48850 RepID=UPI004053C216
MDDIFLKLYEWLDSSSTARTKFPLQDNITESSLDMASTVSSVKSKIARLPKKQESITHIERQQLIETDQEMAQILDLKYKYMSAVTTKKFKILMENLDLRVEEIREILKNDLKEMLGVKSIIPEMKNSTISSNNKKEWLQIRDLALQIAALVERIEGQNVKIVDDIENLTFNRREINKLSELDKCEEYVSDQFQHVSQNHRVTEDVEENLSNAEDRYRNCNTQIDVTGERNTENGEDELLKEMRKEKNLQNFENEEKILKTSVEEKLLIDEGAVLTLAADFSSATLDLRKQWSHIFNILRENDFEPTFLCQAKLAFKCDGEIKVFSDLQSLRKFIAPKSSMKELLKDVPSLNGKINQGGSRHGVQEKVGKTLIDSKHGDERTTSDGLSFLFIKEVKVAEPEEMRNLETQEEESSEWKEKETPELVEEEEEGVTSELEEEGEEASGLEEEDGGTSELEKEGEEASGLEEEDGGTSELEKEGEEASGLEEEDGGNSELEKDEEEASGLHKEQDSTFQGHNVVDTKYEVEGIPRDVKKIEDMEPEEEEVSEWEIEKDLTWEERKTSKREELKSPSKTEKEEASHGFKEIAFNNCVWDSDKKQLVKHQMVDKTQKEEKTAMLPNQEVRTSSPTLRLTSPSNSLEMSYGKQNKHSCTNLTTPPEVTKLLRKTEKERYKILQTEEQTSKEADLIKEPKENLRKLKINSFREIQEATGKVNDQFKQVLESKNVIDAFDSRMDMLEKKISSLESEATMQMAELIIDKERLRDIEDRTRSSNIRLIGIPEKYTKENGAEEIIKEIIEENFPELKQDLSLEIISAYRVPSKIDEKRLTPRHILVRFWNASDKKKIIKASRERKEVTYKGERIRLTADLSLDTLDARSKWGNIMKVLQEKGFKPKILYPAKLAFNFEGKTKIFLDIEEFRKFISYIPSFKELLTDTAFQHDCKYRHTISFPPSTHIQNQQVKTGK